MATSETLEFAYNFATRLDFRTADPRSLSLGTYEIYPNAIMTRDTTFRTLILFGMALNSNDRCPGNFHSPEKP